jgi:hypothetical protein
MADFVKILSVGTRFVLCLQTDTHTDRQTDRQTEIIIGPPVAPDALKFTKINRHGHKHVNLNV